MAVARLPSSTAKNVAIPITTTARYVRVWASDMAMGYLVLREVQVLGNPVPIADAKSYYYLAGRRVALRATEGVKWLPGAPQGFAALMTDAAGKVTANQRYTPLGAVRVAGNAAVTAKQRTTDDPGPPPGDCLNCTPNVGPDGNVTWIPPGGDSGGGSSGGGGDPGGGSSGGGSSGGGSSGGGSSGGGSSGGGSTSSGSGVDNYEPPPYTEPAPETYPYEPYTPSYSDPASDSSQQQDTAGAVVEQGYGDPNPTGSVFDTFIDAAANVVSAVVDAILPVQSASAASEVASAEFGGGEPPASGNPTDVYFPVVTNNSPTESQVFLPMVTDNIQNEVGSGAVNENPITPNFVEVNNNLPPISQESLQAEAPMDALRAVNENTPPVLPSNPNLYCVSSNCDYTTTSVSVGIFSVSLTTTTQENHTLSIGYGRGIGSIVSVVSGNINDAEARKNPDGFVEGISSASGIGWGLGSNTNVVTYPNLNRSGLETAMGLDSLSSGFKYLQSTGSTSNESGYFAGVNVIGSSIALARWEPNRGQGLGLGDIIIGPGTVNFNLNDVTRRLIAIENTISDGVTALINP